VMKQRVRVQRKLEEFNGGPNPTGHKIAKVKDVRQCMITRRRMKDAGRKCIGSCCKKVMSRMKHRFCRPWKKRKIFACVVDCHAEDDCHNIGRKSKGRALQAKLRSL